MISAPQMDMIRPPSLVTTNTNVVPKDQDETAALAAAAKEFEALFMHMMLKNMRNANRVLSEGNYLKSFETDMYEDMLDEQLSTHMSGRGSLGLADLLVDQLSGPTRSRNYSLEFKPVSREQLFSSSEDFVRQLAPLVQDAAASLQTEPTFIMAQAALETGWGAHVMQREDGRSSHNLFGIKANKDWTGDKVIKASMEVEDGIANPVRSPFRAYDSLASSIDDYTAFVKQPRYESVSGSQRIEDFADGLVRGGYATDPQYAQKLRRVHQSLTELLGGGK